MEKNYRVHTSISNDTVLNVNLRQDFDFLEVLSLKLNQADVYRKHTSNYGVIVGRVLANDAFGIPNVRVSVFVKVDADEEDTLKEFYSYSTVTSVNNDNIRYNLLPDESNSDCYRVVGTFPSKSKVLDNDVQVEVFGKYWKFTTTTNQAGDYMIFGVPVGTQQIHTDIDLSDIGILSQKPRDLLYKGYNISQFDNPSQFKKSSNLNNLTQIISQDNSVDIHPFWGDTDTDIVAITRADIQIQYKFEPTCVFLGAIMSDNSSNAIGHNCSPSVKSGLNKQLITGEGTIEMIRKTTDGLTEEYQIQGNRLIDGNGVWCYQIPMNLDYVATDEYGNIVPTEDPSKGIPTRTRVRFRISKDESSDEGFSRHTAKYLVPNNPVLKPNSMTPMVENGTDVEKAYTFGSTTPDEHFRDLYWNKVYSVKNYIPRFQTRNGESTQNYSGIKTTNDADNQNYIPFNKIKFRLPMAYVALCIVFEIVIAIVGLYNKLVYELSRKVLCPTIFGVNVWCIHGITCVKFNGMSDSENVTYMPNCGCPSSTTCKDTSCAEPNCRKDSSRGNLNDSLQQGLGQDYTIAKLDFYNDWLNGSLYMPLWYWKKRKKTTFLFGLFTRKAQNEYCRCTNDKSYSAVRFLYPCSLKLNSSLNYIKGHGNKRYHKGNDNVSVVSSRKGIIKPVENKDGLTAYYYTSLIPSSNQYDNLSTSDFSEINNEASIIRTFATDIILLGSLNDSDSDGLPQLYESLPSTTANIPMIASIKESADDTEDDINLFDENTDNGTVVITGMDWENSGSKDKPTYGKGLFMDLSCTNVSTKPKTCINVERLSELSVNLDMQYNMQYNYNGDLVTGTIFSDGMVTKMELEDNNTRSMFASMNHIGFVPTNVSEEKCNLETQIIDSVTGFYKNKFKFIYPTDFDGRLSKEAQAYTNNSLQKTFDYKDEAYLLFRYGETKRFYEVSSGTYAFPLYNNSFYFFFGLNAGNTAIDKFRNLYYASCSKDNTFAFNIDATWRANSSCESNQEKDIYHSFISVDLDGIQYPFSYTLYLDGNKVYSESGINGTKLTFGADTDNVDDTTATDGHIYTHSTENGSPLEKTEKKLINGKYTLVVTDSNGNSNDIDIDLNNPNIQLSLTSGGLGKRYISGTTEKSDICSLGGAFYGIIAFDNIIVDGKKATITSMGSIDENGHIIPSSSGETTLTFNTTFEGENIVGNEASITVTVMDNDNITDCLCDSTTEVPFMTYENDRYQLNVFQPTTYQIQITQICDGEMNTGNTSVQTVTISNGEDFRMYINDTPVDFLIGENGTIENVTKYNKHFYSPTLANDPHTSPSLLGWLDCFKEDVYTFPPITNSYTDVWTEYVSEYIPNDISSKREIVEFKFQNIFNVANATYVTDSGENQFRITTKGGVSPILARSMASQYEFEDGITSDVIFETKSNVILDQNYPNIVASNYSSATGNTKIDENTAQFNPLFPSSKRERIGNYFASFTKNGGIGNSFADNQIQSVPLQANPFKNIKTSEERIYSNYGDSMTSVFQQSSGKYPYLRAMFVDRRIDYDLIVIGSINFGEDLYLDAVEKNCRISGVTYNGISLSYDDNYNIIDVTANEKIETVGDEEITSYTYTKNTGLEYSYDENNGKTVWNESPSQRRRLYSATINGHDIRDWFWSENNKAEKSESDTEFSGVTFISHNTTSDNGGTSFGGTKYSKKPFGSTSYPTHSLIDAYNIPLDGYFDLRLASCSFNITPTIDENGKINAITQASEETSIRFNIENPIRIIANDDEDVKVIYNPSASTISTKSINSQPNTAWCTNLLLKFKFNHMVDSSCYTKIESPLLFKVKKKATTGDETNLADFKMCDKSFSSMHGKYMEKGDVCIARATIDLDSSAQNKYDEETRTKILVGFEKTNNDTKEPIINGESNELLDFVTIWSRSDVEYFYLQDSDNLFKYTIGTIKYNNLNEVNADFLTILSPRYILMDKNQTLTKQINLASFASLIDNRYFYPSLVGGTENVSGLIDDVKVKETYNCDSSNYYVDGIHEISSANKYNVAVTFNDGVTKYNDGVYAIKTGTTYGDARDYVQHIIVKMGRGINGNLNQVFFDDDATLVTSFGYVESDSYVGTEPGVYRIDDIEVEYKKTFILNGENPRIGGGGVILDFSFNGRITYNGSNYTITYQTKSGGVGSHTGDFPLLQIVCISSYGIPYKLRLALLPNHNVYAV